MSKVALSEAAGQIVLFCDLFKGRVRLNYLQRKSPGVARTDGKSRLVRLLKNAGTLKPSGLSCELIMKRKMNNEKQKMNVFFRKQVMFKVMQKFANIPVPC